MRKRLFYWEVAGFLWTAILGSLLHFTFQWSGNSALAAAFSAVNESTWEHMKLLFFPMFFFSLLQLWAIGGKYPNFLAARALSVLAGMFLIPTLYYTYTGALGVHLLWADFLVFLLADLGAFLLDFYLLSRGCCSRPWQQIAGLLVLWLLAFCFVWCTFRPPQIALWRDMVTGGFGIP